MRAGTGVITSPARPAPPVCDSTRIPAGRKKKCVEEVSRDVVRTYACLPACTPANNQGGTRLSSRHRMMVMASAAHRQEPQQPPLKNNRGDRGGRETRKGKQRPRELLRQPAGKKALKRRRMQDALHAKTSHHHTCCCCHSMCDSLQHGGRCDSLHH